MRTISKGLLYFLAVLALIGCAPRRTQAQFIGYSSPQTVNQKVFTNQTTAAASPATSPLACTPVNGTPCAIPNLGQTLHSVTYVVSNPCGSGFTMDLRIEATNDGTTWFAISEDATDQTAGYAIQGTSIAGLTAVGSYAGYRLNLVQMGCGGGGTPAITAFYSGTSTALPNSTGPFYQATPYRKTILVNSPTTSASGLTPVAINVPSGVTGGALYVACFTTGGATTSCPVGMQINYNAYVVNNGGGGGNVPSIQVVALAVPNAVNPIIKIANTPAASMVFSFSGTGTAGVNWSIYYMANSVPISPFVTDPCQSPGTAKGSIPIQINTATTTQLLAAVSGQGIYVCGGFIDIASSGTSAATIQLEYGTGASCGTGTVALTGTMGTGTATAGIPALPITFPSGVMSLSTPTSNAVCAVTAGTTVNAQGFLIFVQQ